MTNVPTWTERLRRELRKQWWQTLTVILAIGLGAGLWLAFTGTETTVTPTATAETTYTLTLTQGENGRLVAVPGTRPFTAGENTAVTVTATPNHGYELTAWGGDCATTLATSATCVLDMNAARSATATFGRATPPPASGPLVLTVISDGAADALTLEWTGGPANASRWQYRTTYWNQQAYRREAWGSWANIPNSGTATNSYRLSGLRSGTGHFIEVRPVVGSNAGTPSNTDSGITHRTGSIPYIGPGQIVEGDGKTAWRIHALAFTIVIPDGMRLRGSSGGIAEGPTVVSVQDLATGSWLTLTYAGTEWERSIVTPAVGEGQRVPVNPQRDVGRLFDQIVASVRLDQ